MPLHVVETEEHTSSAHWYPHDTPQDFLQLHDIIFKISGGAGCNFVCTGCSPSTVWLHLQRNGSRVLVGILIEASVFTPWKHTHTTHTLCKRSHACYTRRDVSEIGYKMWPDSRKGTFEHFSENTLSSGMFHNVHWLLLSVLLQLQHKKLLMSIDFLL